MTIMAEAHKTQGRTTTNRNPCKQWFITFPQTKTDKHSFRDALQSINPLKYYKIAEETHRDGGLHLHAVVVLTQSMPKSAILRKLKIIYPDDYKRIDVQSTRSIKHALAYISKEDQNPLESAEPYSDPRNPLRAFHTRIARQWGFNSVEEFQSYQKQEMAYQSQLQSTFYEMCATLNRKVIQYPKLLESFEVKYLRFLERRIENDLSLGFQISKDDMTQFINLYNSSVELL